MQGYLLLISFRKLNALDLSKDYHEKKKKKKIKKESNQRFQIQSMFMTHSNEHIHNKVY